MTDYPDILGIKMNMAIEDINKVMINLGFNTLIKDQRTYGDGYLVNSKIDNSELFWFQFTDDGHLYNIHINNWKEFFGFYFDEFNFSNMFEIFKDYFLKNFEYTLIPGVTSKTTSLKNDKWRITFMNDGILGERITYFKV